MSEGLFVMEPSPRLAVGEKVIAACSWGDERAVVIGHQRVDGFPVVRLQLAGDVVDLSPARIRRANLGPG